MQIVDLQRETPRIEWPTVALAVVIYGIWFAATYGHENLPLPALVLLGAVSVAWHMNLQHEIIHGHPTRWRGVNEAIGVWPLAIWLPYSIYRSSHMRHHNDATLTDPLDDPESYYVTAEQWEALGPVARTLVRAQSILLGRLVIGPLWATWRLWRDLIGQMARGEPGALRIAVTHALQVAVVLIWVMGVCRMSLWTYLLCFVYPGTALAMVRSFAEHKADAEAGRRTAIVEGAAVMGPLFLFNNLHVAHHTRPALPWYRLPAFHRLNREVFLERNGGLLYRGYGEIFRRFLFARNDSPVHPFRHGRSA